MILPSLSVDLKLKIPRNLKLKTLTLRHWITSPGIGHPPHKSTNHVNYRVLKRHKLKEHLTYNTAQKQNGKRQRAITSIFVTQRQLVTHNLTQTARGLTLPVHVPFVSLYFPRGMEESTKKDDGCEGLRLSVFEGWTATGEDFMRFFSGGCTLIVSVLKVGGKILCLSSKMFE